MRVIATPTLAYERDSGRKHEYVDGEILAVAGGSRRHNALASRISAALESGATITNPPLLVEVLSASSEEEDRGAKWHHHQLLPSLQEYVLVSQAPPRIERYRRLESGRWEYEDVTTGTVTLLAGAKLQLDVPYSELPD